MIIDKWKNCVISLAWKKKKKKRNSSVLELPNYCVSIIRTCKWSWILSFPENRGTDHFGELPFHWQLGMESNDALAIYYGSCNGKTCCDTSLNVCVDSNDMILHLWRYHSYSVKVVMMTTLLTVVLCIVCNIGCTMHNVRRLFRKRKQEVTLTKLCLV